MKIAFFSLLSYLVLIGCQSGQDKKLATNQSAPKITEKTQESSFQVVPISHATMVINWSGKVIYVDPVGGAQLFASFPAPDLVLVTDIHGDHMDAETLGGINTSNAKIVVPKAVADKLPASLAGKIEILNNGQNKEFKGIQVAAIPMYNLREEALKFHTKGRGNGYVLQWAKERVYISGDTEDIPEMRSLKNIDRAFVCMNLPYTMTEESAASAVLEFKPKTIYPYHYRGTEGLSDVAKFKELVNQGDPGIAVKQLDWYPQ